MQVRRKTVPLTPEDVVFFDRFFAANKSLMAHFAARVCFDASKHEDLVQDVAERLMRQIPTLRAIEDEPGKVAYYIYAATQSAFIDKYRVNSTESETMSHEDLGPLPDPMSLMHRAPLADAYWDVQQLRQKLAERDWQLLEGKYIIGYTDEELAQLCGIKHANIRMALSRAKKRAQRILFNAEKGGTKHDT
ncbi:MAG: sigma-70 family RNA polymerase sigma factor [Oscillospiraceae bacterium]|nr:sigma-70 family RNA polymerase sigma factor [Oscillospiraceae bacterium]